MRISHVSRISLLGTLVAGLGACAATPMVVTGAGTDVNEARRILIVQATDGPIPLTMDAVPAVLGGPGADADVAAIANRAAGWSRATFVSALAVPATGPHMVFSFDGTASATANTLCAGTAPRSTQPSFGAQPIDIRAVFCDGPRPVADATGVATGPDPADAQRVVDATVTRLFPDPTGSERVGGFPGVSLGVGVGTGSGGSGGGVGIGIGSWF